jgi:hypothetical protein
MNRPGTGSRAWLSPLIHLSNNPISLLGVVLVTTAAVFLIFLLPTLWSGKVDNPYMGIVIFMALPAVFISGLLLIPLGIYFRNRREKREGVELTSFPPLDLRNKDFRHVAIFIGLTTFVNIIIAGHLAYGSVTYMDSVEFCGQTCHTVMKPEYTAYLNSPHSRVECVKCHIGPGADWFVKSKLSGAYQVFAVTFNTHPRPIPTPVENLRPARETCETCHWPQKFGGDRLRVLNKYADDEANTASKTVLLMRIGGGNGSTGIHGYHLGAGVRMRYAPADESRQSIPVVEYTSGDGNWVRFIAQDAKPEDVARLTRPEAMREMDCMDCHNRPSHTFQLPDRALDEAMAQGAISAALPFAKKQALELLKGSYSTQQEGIDRITGAFESFYSEKYPEVYSRQREAIQSSGKAIAGIYSRNVFPEMKVNWGSYPNNLGHTDFPGCFRCHDEQHVSSDGRTIGQDCSSCHSLLAMDEPSPKVLTDLGVTSSVAAGTAQ